MSKTSKYKARSFESAGGKNGKNDTYAAIYDSMLYHPAFMSLKNRQKVLYLYIKSRYFGHKKPREDFPDIPDLRGDDLFYFPLTAGIEAGIYTSSMKRELYNDIKALEEHGLIRTVFNGKPTKRKSIYGFSNKWQTWEGG